MVVHQALRHATESDAPRMGSACLDALIRAESTDGLMEVVCSPEGLNLVGWAVHGLERELGSQDVDKLLEALSESPELWPAPGRFPLYSAEQVRFGALSHLVICHGTDAQFCRLLRMVEQTPVDREMMKWCRKSWWRSCPKERLDSFANEQKEVKGSSEVEREE